MRIVRTECIIMSRVGRRYGDTVQNIQNILSGAFGDKTALVEVHMLKRCIWECLVAKISKRNEKC